MKKVKQYTIKAFAILVMLTVFWESSGFVNVFANESNVGDRQQLMLEESSSDDGSANSALATTVSSLPETEGAASSSTTDGTDTAVSTEKNIDAETQDNDSSVLEKTSDESSASVTSSDEALSEAETSDQDAASVSSDADSETETDSQVSNAVPFAAPLNASTNLADLLTNVSISAPTDGNGNYIINPSSSYDITLTFGENENIQFDDNAEQTYTLPNGLLTSNIPTTKFEINIVDQSGAATIVDNTFKVVNGVLYVSFNKLDPNFSRLSALSNVKFKVRFSSKFDQNVNHIEFNTIIAKDFVYKEDFDLAITKTATYDKTTDTAKYVLKITSTGANSNVVIQDAITGTALTFKKDVSVESSVQGVLTVTPDYTSITNGFRVTVPQMTDGEILTIRYSAKVDNEKITGNGTVEQTNNKAKVTSNQIPDGKEAEANLADKINFHKISKERTSEPVSIGNNKYEIPWRIRINEDHKLTVGGKKISDAVTSSSQQHMQFTGSGITMAVTMENGTTEVRVIPWAQLVTTSNDKGIISWEYTAPVSDGKASYAITYKTLADTTGVTLDLVVANQAKVGDNFSVDASAAIKILGDKLTIEKGLVNNTPKETEWQITVHVVPAGYSDLKVSDDLPKLQLGTTYYFDRLVDGSINVAGLLPGESYKLTKVATATANTIYLDFYKDAAQTTTGLKPTDDGTARDIVITLKTKVNQDWLTLAANSGYTSNQIHRNYSFARVAGNLVGDNVQAIPKKQVLVKEFTDQTTVAIDGVNYPVFRYVLTLENAYTDTTSISDAFNTEYLKYYDAEAIDIYSGTQAEQPHAGGTATAVDTATGINIQITGLPRDADDKLYPITKIYYSLIVKDLAALNALNQAALNLPKGYILENTATWDEATSETVGAAYTYYPYVDKELITRPTADNGYVAEFKIIINKYAQDLDPNSDELEIQDALSSNLRFIPDSLTISPQNETILYQHDTQTNTLTFSKVPDGTTFEITYRARVLGSGTVEYSNTVKLGDYKKTIAETATIESSGSGTGSNPSITLVKRDQELLSHTLSGATFQLYYMNGNVRTPVMDKNGQIVTFTTGSNGSVLIVGNQQLLGWTLWSGRTYCLVETSAPTGFVLDDTPNYFVLSETPTTQSEYDISGDKINLQDARIKIDIPVKKTWNGPKGDSVTVRLMKGSSEVANQVLGDENNWKFNFTNLDKYDENDQEISYYVIEDPVENYSTTIAGNPTDGFTVTNTISEKTSIPVTKTWIGPEAEGVTVRLMNGDTEIASQALNAQNNWQYTFENLEKYDGNGDTIQYTVIEDPVENYSTTITGNSTDGFTITNTNTEKISIPVTKTWVGEPDASAAVRLVADGVEKGIVLLNAGNGWQHTFADLPKYDTTTGSEIQYTITEDAIEGYTSAISGTAQTGFSLTNTITGKVSIPVTKIWVGPTGTSATVRLLAAGVEKDIVVLNESNGWQHTFMDLDQYDGSGNAIQYTITEDPVEGYASEISGNMADGYTIKNTNTATTLVEIKKQWAGSPLDAVTVKLLADGVEVQEVTLNADSNWQHTFENLPKYDMADGHEIVYTVSENVVEGYITAISGTAETGFTITNTITGKISIPVTKIWIGPAAGSVTIRLMNGDTEIASQTLNAENNWQHTFMGLDQYDGNGNAIQYTITEDAVTGYSSQITGDMTNGFTVTNTNIDQTTITVKKVWEGKAKDSATVYLLANGERIDSHVLSKDNNWQFVFSNLPKYKNGEEILYSVEEELIIGYISTVTFDKAKGLFIITNIEVGPDPTQPPSGGKVPKTGDSGNSIPWLIIMILSGLGVIVFRWVKKILENKRKN